MDDELWPSLPYDAWKDTYATLHMWMQVVGKVALSKAPPLNHSWGIALQVTPSGLITRTLAYGARSFTMEFDFLEHELVIATSDGDRRTLELRPQTVADFYREVRQTLEEMALPVKIWPMPVEIADPIRFDEDTQHHSYDRAFVARFWQIIRQIERIFTRERCGFVGKSSPAHFFWGSFDLAVTRFSGRPAPRRDGPAFMQDAYSHEVISHGFWLGGPDLEPAFYTYAVPEPEGFKEAVVAPDQAFYHKEMGEFILSYEAVRAAPSPDQAIESFISSTYERAATLAKWDRSALERDIPAQAT
ncbi:MAG: DUF5996 family protein [Acidobacteriota bacterium]